MRTLALLLALSAFSLPAFATDEATGAFHLESTASLKLSPGKSGLARVEVVPREGAHVSPDAPVSLAVSAGPLLALDKAKLGRGDARETKARGIAFDVPVRAQKAGVDAVHASLTFFICTEKICERQKKELSIPVQVQ